MAGGQSYTSVLNASLVWWSLRLLGVGMVVVAVVLVATVPHSGGSTCGLSPWMYWRRGGFGFVGVPSPISVQLAQHVEACVSLMSDRWHLAWGLGLGGILLLVGSLLPRRLLTWGRRHDPHPVTT